jgi:Terminase large subunit, ATPase domain
VNSAYEVLASLRLEDGRPWGRAATPVQREDALAVLDERSLVRFHYVIRSRGFSKTSDLAGITLAVLLRQAPARSRSYCVAANQAQARLLLDSIEGFVVRTPELAGLVEVQAWKVVALSSGATVETLAADTQGTWGLRPFFAVADEVSNWGTSGAPERIWEALSSAIPKTGGRLVAITSAGSPDHWAFKLREHAEVDPLWRLSEIAGPPPWADQGLIAEQERRLPASLFARLFKNIWTAPEDRLARGDDLRACAVLTGPLPPVAGVEYVVTLDVGITHDRTVALVAHGEALTDGRGEQTGVRVVVDALRVWQGSPAAPVQLPEVGEAVAAFAAEYNGATVIYDPHQSIELSQRLTRRGIESRRFNFGTASVGELGLALHTAIRNRTVLIPNDQFLLDVLAAVRLRESSPGSFRLDHAAGGHDDQAVCLAMACHHFQRHRAKGRMVASFVPRSRLPEPSALRDRSPGQVRVFGAGDWIGEPPDGAVTRRRLDLLRRRRSSVGAEPMTPLPPDTVVARVPESSHGRHATTLDRHLQDLGIPAADGHELDDLLRRGREALS